MSTHQDQVPPVPSAAAEEGPRPTANLLTNGIVLTVLGLVLLGTTALDQDPASVGTHRGLTFIAVCVLVVGTAALATGVHRIATRSDRRAGVPEPLWKQVRD